MTLNRPEHNLLNEAMLRDIATESPLPVSAEDVKLIVPRFCRQGFLRRHRHCEYTPACLSNARRFHGAFRACWKLASPSFAVVNGPASRRRGTAAFGDLVHRHSKARFAQPEISIGRFPPLASTILPFLVGPKCSRACLTGEPVTAERALDLVWSIASSPKPTSNKP